MEAKAVGAEEVEVTADGAEEVEVIEAIAFEA